MGIVAKRKPDHRDNRQRHIHNCVCESKTENTILFFINECLFLKTGKNCCFSCFCLAFELLRGCNDSLQCLNCHLLKVKF